MSMTSNRPYLVKAFYDWIVANECSPYIVVNALEEGVQVPQDYVSDGQIVLNLSPASVKNMIMNLEGVAFNARFGGVPMDVEIPVEAIMGIYARENGQGMIFQPEPVPEPDPNKPKGSRPKVVSSSKGESETDNNKKPSLHIVK